MVLKAILIICACSTLVLTSPTPSSNGVPSDNADGGKEPQQSRSQPGLFGLLGFGNGLNNGSNSDSSSSSDSGSNSGLSSGLGSGSSSGSGSGSSNGLSGIASSISSGIASSLGSALTSSLSNATGGDLSSIANQFGSGLGSGITSGVINGIGGITKEIVSLVLHETLGRLQNALRKTYAEERKSVGDSFDATKAFLHQDIETIANVSKTAFDVGTIYPKFIKNFLLYEE